MKKQKYGKHILDAISALNNELLGSNKKDLINKIYHHIEQTTGLSINEENRTSLYNTIYYFLRKTNVFKADEVNHRFDSMTSKQGFIKTLKNDLVTRQEKYRNIFFGRSATVEDSDVCIIDSKKSPAHDILYTVLYFRDIRKLLILDNINQYSKKPLNDKLYSIFDNLYGLNDVFSKCVGLLSEHDRSTIEVNASDYYRFLSEFNCVNKSTFNFEIMRHLVVYNRFNQVRNLNMLSDCNNRYFDSFSFINIVYSKILTASSNENGQYDNIHYLINAATYFLFSKYSKKMKQNYVSKLVEFFASDVYFASVKYIIDYYNIFMNEVNSLFDLSYYNYGVIIKEFDIVLKYMLYNKFKNIVSANIKRYIGIATCSNETAYIDVDGVEDNVLYCNSLFSSEDPCENIEEKRFANIYNDFFSKCESINKNDITNVAIDMFHGDLNILKYDKDTIKHGKRLYKLMKETLT